MVIEAKRLPVVPICFTGEWGEIDTVKDLRALA